MDSGALSNLTRLTAKVDAFFERVHARYAGEIACRPGCDDCCRRRLSVTGVEAAAIATGLAGQDERARAEVGRRARESSDRVCAALGPDGRCGIYAFRPLVCRSHGLPLRFAHDREGAPVSSGAPVSNGAPGRRSLPVLDACAKNFTERELASIDADCVLDQATLSTLLAAVDAAHAAETGRARGERFDLAELLTAQRVQES
jgi:hypothetical protein